MCIFIYVYVLQEKGMGRLCLSTMSSAWVDLCGWLYAYVYVLCACITSGNMFSVATGWTWVHGAATALGFLGYQIWQFLINITDTYTDSQNSITHYSN